MTAFDIDRTVAVAGDSDDVWRLIVDVPRLVSWISILSEAREIENLKSYSAVISDKVGMFKLRADLAITVLEVDEPRRIVVEADGQDRQVGSRISCHVEVTLGTHEIGTEVCIRGSYAITGNAATLGSSTIRRKGEKLVEEFCSNLVAESSVL